MLLHTIRAQSQCVSTTYTHYCPGPLLLASARIERSHPTVRVTLLPDPLSCCLVGLQLSLDAFTTAVCGGEAIPWLKLACGICHKYLSTCICLSCPATVLPSSQPWFLCECLPFSVRLSSVLNLVACLSCLAWQCHNCKSFYLPSHQIIQEKKRNCLCISKFNGKLTPALDKRIDSTGKEFFRMGAQPLMHRWPNLIVVLKLRSTQRILQWTEHVKIQRRMVRWLRRVWDALKSQLLNNRHCYCSSMWLCVVVGETHSCRQWPAPFLANSWLQIFPQKVWVGGTGHSASSGHVVL